MADRAYLTEAMPMCVIWGAEDRVIPTSHAARAAELAPKARIEILPNAGHFPHKDHPELFVKVLHDFVRTTAPRRTPGRAGAGCSSGADAPAPCRWPPSAPEVRAARTGRPVSRGPSAAG